MLRVAELFISDSCKTSTARNFSMRGTLRKVWHLISFVTLAVICASAAQMQDEGTPSGRATTVSNQQQELHYRASRGRPLTIISPKDGSFESEMALYFPNFVGLPNYQAVKPFLVIARNDTERTARAYDIVWRLQVPDASAPGGTSEQKFSEQEAVVTPLELRHPAGISEVDKSIRPGERRLFSPFFNGGPTDTDTFIVLNDPTRFPNAGSYMEVNASADCVVYGDGSFAGPNLSRVLLRYFITRDAQHDEALSILRSLRSSPTLPDLRRNLELRAQIGSSPNYLNDRAMPVYVRARGIAAGEFEKILLSEGVSKLQTTVNELVTIMPPHEMFTALGGTYHRIQFRLNGSLVSPSD